MRRNGPGNAPLTGQSFDPACFSIDNHIITTKKAEGTYLVTGVVTLGLFDAAIVQPTRMNNFTNWGGIQQATMQILREDWMRYVVAEWTPDETYQQAP